MSMGLGFLALLLPVLAGPMATPVALPLLPVLGAFMLWAAPAAPM